MILMIVVFKLKKKREERDISISLLNISRDTSNSAVNSHLLPKTFQEHNIPARLQRDFVISPLTFCFSASDSFELSQFETALGRFLTIIILDLRRRKRSSDSGRKFAEIWKSKTTLKIFEELF